MKDRTPTPSTPVKLPDLFDGVRDRLRRTLEEMLNEELTVVLEARASERSERRRGYRHGAIERTVTTANGPQRMKIPRGRIADEEGTAREWRSELLPAYQRRTRAVDEAILGVYLAGGNTRRIRRALEPLLGTLNLSKSAVSRIVGRLKTSFEAWCTRDLTGESYAVVYLDAIYLSVRVARRVMKVPVQVVLGVNGDGQKIVIGMQAALRESTSDWRAMIDSLRQRGLADPALVIVDGSLGLRGAIERAWPKAEVQRCTQHKFENLKSKVPTHAHAELKRDYRAITHALSGENALRAYNAFLAKWEAICPAAAKSLTEGGLELLTFYRFPRAMWKSLRSTNTLERLNQEFRRRVKTQGSMPNESAGLVLLYGLLAFGQIKLRRIDGWKAIPMMRDAIAEKVA
jgi:transposase-like protein